MKFHLIHISQRGTKTHLKSQFPPEMTLLKSQQNFQSCLKSNFLSIPNSNICFKRVKLTIGKSTIPFTDRQFLIPFLSTSRRFTHSHWFIHFSKGGLTIKKDKKRLHLKYMLKVETVTKGS